MLYVKTQIVDAVKDYKEDNSQTKSSVCRKYNIDKATLSKYMSSGIDDLIYAKEYNCFVKLTPKEWDAVKRFRNGEMRSRDAVMREYGFHIEKFSKILNILGIGYKNEIYKYKLNENALSKISKEKDAYVLAFILTDGYICTQRNTIKIKLNKKDENILTKIKEYFEYDAEITHRTHNITKNELSELSIHNVHIMKTVLGYVDAAKKAERKVFFHDVPEDIMCHYIRGIFDADGFIRKNACQTGLCGSKEVIDFVFDFLSTKLKLSGGTKPYFDKSSKIYRFSFCGENAVRVMKYLYEGATIYIDRKYELAMQYIQSYGHVKIG